MYEHAWPGNIQYSCYRVAHKSYAFFHVLSSNNAKKTVKEKLIFTRQCNLKRHWKTSIKYSMSWWQIPGEKGYNNGLKKISANTL